MLSGIFSSSDSDAYPESTVYFPLINSLISLNELKSGIFDKFKTFFTFIYLPLSDLINTGHNKWSLLYPTKSTETKLIYD